ncbi:hypothetical protein T484DRAFT_1851735 [Baffinella frigidus]|nr:hypothetical protein T484DRAFT_1851735 [Cryptophyta sp. CCMP2293]
MGDNLPALLCGKQTEGTPCSVVAVSAGWYHTCALTQERLVFCWGGNLWGQLGLSTAASSVVCGAFHTCAISQDLTTPVAGAPELQYCTATLLYRSKVVAKVGG